MNELFEYRQAMDSLHFTDEQKNALAAQAAKAAEIGQILGTPTATIHTWLARGRARLKTMLGGTDYERTV